MTVAQPKAVLRILPADRVRKARSAWMMAMALHMCSGATPGPATLGLSVRHQDLETQGALAPSDFVEAHERGDGWLRRQVVQRADSASLDGPRREDPGFVPY